jgi:hypothetical protein
MSIDLMILIGIIAARSLKRAHGPNVRSWGETRRDGGNDRSFR